MKNEIKNKEQEVRSKIEKIEKVEKIEKSNLKTRPKFTA